MPTTPPPPCCTPPCCSNNVPNLPTRPHHFNCAPTPSPLRQVRQSTSGLKYGKMACDFMQIFMGSLSRVTVGLAGASTRW